ncbi:bifunctional diguanylate cyclase/phosphodiesterase [Roseomonas sp. 18066]|uniref:putative bifunctional diguanylate cyclase/phosphodiesterase n=1 Tax=Roseomonas sp. 18066 TaxID=2681412 RepID=UPI0013593E82|nr:EAL domain-containing protein [Roseomonas sp. 18066]
MPVIPAAELALMRERDRLQSLLDTNSDWIWEVDAAGRYTFVSAHAELLLGFPPEDILGRTPFDFMPAEEAERVGALFAGIVARRAPFSGLLNRNRRADGREVVLETSGIPLVGADGRLTGYRGIDRDVTEREERAGRIAYLARHDSLTGLANRPEFMARLEACLAASRPAALLLLDLDFFKEVNDQLGHASGDALLRRVAERMRAALAADCLCARLGGDEFAILMEGFDEAGALAAARRLAATLCEPYQLEARQAVIGVSLGLALAPRHAGGAEALLRCADLALYRAKEEGRGDVFLYDSGLEARQRADEGMEAALRRALAEGEIDLLYQPVFAAEARRMAGCCAVPRWRHPLQGPVPPDTFLALADRTGLVLPLGEMLLRRACLAALSWPSGWRLTVPVTPVQLRDPGFAGMVAQVLAETGLPPARLEIAVGEATLGPAPAEVPRALRKLRAAGVGLALDRFGEGATSLAAFQRFRFDRLRLAPMLVRDVEREPAASLVTAIALLGRRLGLGVGAVGVETPGQLAALLAAGCTDLQGPALAEAVEAAALRPQPWPRPAATIAAR